MPEHGFSIVSASSVAANQSGESALVVAIRMNLFTLKQAWYTTYAALIRILRFAGKDAA